MSSARVTPGAAKSRIATSKHRIDFSRVRAATELRAIMIEPTTRCGDRARSDQDQSIARTVPTGRRKLPRLCRHARQRRAPVEGL